VRTLPTGIVVYETADWGARPAAHGAFPATTPRDLVVHNTASANRAAIADHQAAVQAAFRLARAIQADHMDTNGWSDTGNNFLVTVEGIVLEGRHGSLDAAFAGHCIRSAHSFDDTVAPTADDNDSFGTEHEGTFTTVAVPQACWDASVKLHAFLAFKCDLDSAGIIGHRDTGCNTACPGNAFETALPAFRQQVHAAKVRLMHH
jgi:hypothetical protein